MRSRLSDYLASRWSWAWPVLGVALIAGQVVSLLGNLTAGQGDDFGAYLSAARRLIAGESLYLSSLLEGSALTTGPGQYLYPPPLAQLLAPLAVLPASWEKLLYFVYTAVSVGLFGAALTTLWRRGGGSVTRRGALGCVSLMAALSPVVSSVANGNLGLPLSICFALAALGSPLLGGVSGGAIKLLPASLLLMVRPPLRFGRAALFAAVVILLSLAASPDAWRSYLAEALPGSMRTTDLVGLGGNPAAIARLAGTAALIRSPGGEGHLASLLAEPGLSPSMTMRAVESWPMALAPVELLEAIAILEMPLRLAGLALAAALLLLGARAAADPTRRHVAAAFLASGPLFIPWSLWDHYLVALLPLGVVAWRLGGRPARLRLAIGFALCSSPAGLVLGPYLGIPLALALFLDGIRRTRLPSSGLAPERSPG